MCMLQSMLHSMLIRSLVIAMALHVSSEAFQNAATFSRIRSDTSLTKARPPRLHLRMSGHSRAHQHPISTGGPHPAPHSRYSGTLFPLMSTTLERTAEVCEELETLDDIAVLGSEHIEIDFDQQLGCGTYGDVYLATVIAGRDKGMRAVVKRAKEAHSVAEKDQNQGAIKDGFVEAGGDHSALSESMLAVESFMGRRTTTSCPQFVPRFLGDLEAHGSRWLAWEHVEGEALEDLFQRASEASSLQPVAAALGLSHFEEGSIASLAALVEEIARQLFEGLWALENAGIAHRDIKPENILVSNQRLVLIDFGSAACMGEFPFVGYDYHMAPCDANYCPPERFIDEEQWNKYDVYSCALILIRVLLPPCLGDAQFRAFRDNLFALDNDLDHWFSAKILHDPAVQTIGAQPPFGLSPHDRITAYQQLSALSCALEEEPGCESLCALRAGLTVLNLQFGLRYDTLRSLLAHDPSQRPSAQEALYSLG